MCGRYVIVDGKKILESFSGLKVKDSTALFANIPRFNASPMQRLPVLAVRDNELVVQEMQWWLVPHWSKDGKPSVSAFNARSETVAQSKLFAPYFKSSRCLVPAEAFYEWQKADSRQQIADDRRQIADGGEKKRKELKQPMLIRMKDRSPFMFAGLFSVWKNANGDEFPSFTILTTTPNQLMAPIHNRMPVILSENHFESWLDRENKNTESLTPLLAPYDATEMEAYPVSRYVSNSRNEGEECWRALKIGD
jgi:putative SOS response-associated peptidase YedK